MSMIRDKLTIMLRRYAVSEPHRSSRSGFDHMANGDGDAAKFTAFETLPPVAFDRTALSASPDRLIALEPPSFAWSIERTQVENSETVKLRCEDIMRRVEGLARLGGELDGLFEQFQTVMRELEQARSDLTLNAAALATEREARQTLAAHGETLERELAHLREEIETLRYESKRLGDANRDFANEIGGLRQELAEKTRALGESLEEANVEREKRIRLGEDLHNARDNLQQADTLVSTIRAELSATRNRADQAEAEARALHEAIEDSRSAAERLSRQLSEANHGLRTAQLRTIDLEQSHARQHEEQQKLRGLLDQETEQRRIEVATLKTEIAAVSTRAEAAERLLNEVRADLLIKIEDLTKEERRNQEQAAQISLAERKNAAADQEIRQLKQANLNLSESLDAVAKRSEIFLKATKVKNKEAEADRANLESLSERLRVESARFESDRAALRDVIGTLTIQVEKEKLDRAQAEGALDAARKDREQLMQALKELRKKHQAMTREPQRRARKVAVDQH
jgi:crescentin